MYTNGTKTVDTPRNQNTAHQKELAQLTQGPVLASDLSTKILEAIDAIVVVLDSQGQIVWLNSAAEHLTGFALAELQGQFLWDVLIPPEQVVDVQQVFHALVFDRHPSHSENHWRTRDGQQRLLAWSNTVVQDSAGNVTHVIGTGQDMTQSRPVQPPLHEDESLFRALFDAATDGIIIWSQNYTCLYANQVVIEYFDISKINIYRRKIQDSFSHIPDLMHQWISRVDHVFATGASLSVEETMALGDRLMISASTWLPIRNTQGTIFAVGLICRDNTEQHQAEEALRITSERLAFALEGGNMGVWDWNMLTNSDYLSPHYKRMLGYAPDELPDILESWLNTIHPDDMPRVQQTLQNYLDGHISTYEAPHRLRHKSGEWLWMLARGQVVERDDQGQPTRLTGTISDITAQKHTEDELRLFQAMFENASDPIAIVRASDGIITHYNQAHRSQYRCGDEHLGQPISVIVAPEDQAQLPGILEQIKEQGIWQGQLMHVRQDGTTFPALESRFTIKDSLGNVVSLVGIARDITDVLEVRFAAAAYRGPATGHSRALYTTATY